MASGQVELHQMLGKLDAVMPEGEQAHSRPGLGDRT